MSLGKKRLVLGAVNSAMAALLPRCSHKSQKRPQAPFQCRLPG